MASSSSQKTVDYESVEMSTVNVIIPEEKLQKTPSVLDGLNIEIETDLRIVGCEYIQTAGILLKVPQVTMATGQVLFQRFYYSKSFIRHDVEVYAMASLFLAAKIEECPRRIRDVINVFHHVKQRRNNKPVVPMEYMGNTYFALKNLVIKAERRILKELGFCVHVQHPHKVIITFLQVLDCEKNQALAQNAWNFMNDALRTNVFVRYQPATIACACIFLSARQLKDVCLTFLQLYRRPKVSLQVLNKAVEKLKKNIQERKAASTNSSVDKTKKGTSGEPTFSRPGSPTNNSPVNNTSKSKNDDTKKNGDKKSESHSKGVKKSSKSQTTRKEQKKPGAKGQSPGSDRSYSASGSDSGSDHSDSASDDSGSSQEGTRKKTIQNDVRRSKNHIDERSRDRYDDGRSRKAFKSKTDVNSYRRAHDRSRSPHRRSRSRERRDGRKGDIRGSHSRNGDYKTSDKRDRRR